MTRDRQLRFASMLALVCAAIGCGADGIPPGADPSAVPGTAVTGEAVRGLIRYDGAHDGVLKVAAFSSFPPRGAAMATVVIGAPAFPQAYSLRGLPSGRYFILAILDVDANDGERYHPTVDPGGAFGSYLAPVSVTVANSQAPAAADVALRDPNPNSPWIRNGYR